MELNYVPIIWLALGIAFAVAEGLTVQLVSIWFAIGAAVTALVTALIDIPWPTQLLIFVIVAGVLLAAMAKAQLRFKGASERGWAMGTCEPVNTTGMGTLRSIKLIIEEV